MFQQRMRRILITISTILFTFSLTAPLAWGQHSEGKVNVTVVDPQGAVVSAADLALVDVATNDTRTATTSDRGTYTFVNLDIGTYKLTITKAGFATQTLDNVIVAATKTTDVAVKLTIGAQVQQVQVEAVAPVVETTTNVIGQVIDPKQIETLPISGRDLTQLSRLAPGYNGTWNGLPTSAQGNNVDGVMGSPSRMKFSGNAQASISPRLENIEEMVVQTDSLDLNQGFGQAAMQINYITRRGTNNWHGRAYEDHRNSWLNANSWSNNARGLKRNRLIRNEFGGSVGGPIWKDKLFFFVSVSAVRQPQSSNNTNNVLTSAAQAGNFTYTSGGVTHTVNVLQAANAFNPALPNTVNATVAKQLALINSSLGNGSVASSTDPNINSFGFLVPNPRNELYPTMRFDYNMTSAVRMNFSVNRSETQSPVGSLPYFPGNDFIGTEAGNKSDAATVGYGLDWTITPTLINQFKAGWLYNATFFAYNSNHGYFNDPTVWSWPGPFQIANGPNASGHDYYRPINTYYPVWNFSDTLAWQKGAHNFSFGGSFVREQDHYWNGPEGIATINFGLVTGDPALTALQNTGSYQPLPGATTAQQTEAQNLYAILTGRISGVSGLYAFDPNTGGYIHGVGSYNLNELAKAWGLFFQDSWKMKPSFTLNYGLRWDFTGDDHDLTSEYHNSDVSSIFGPTAPQNLFKPGQLGGNLNPTIDTRSHAYNSWNKSPQPAIGFAWSPSREGGMIGRIVGKNQTVIRGGYSLRRFTVPYQYIWDTASDYGSFYYQNFALTSTNTPGTGNFAPGSLALGQSLPGYALSPLTFQNSIPVSQFTFVGGAPGVNGFPSHISQPYTESWNFGIQRGLGVGRAIEIRYNGNRTLKQWITINPNEVNVFENGFLKEFQAAQNNLKINGGNSFANLNPGAGTVPLAIIGAAFNGVSNNNGYGNSTFINDLNTGQVGDFARRLASNGAGPYYCNLVGTAFGPCAVKFPAIAGAGYPINFWQANPYATRGTTAASTGLMTDAGYSSYNGLQVDFRQQPWHGLQFDANYTWSKTLGILPGGSGNDWTGAYTAFSLRDLRASYLPASFDAHHVVHANASIDLPVGRGKMLSLDNGVLDRIFGGWNVGTILTIQSGYPNRITGGYLTYNQGADSGVVLNGITRQDLQNAVGVHRIPGATFALLMDPKYLNFSSPGCATQWVAGCAINGLKPQYATPNTTPGTYNAPLYLYGPKGFYQDMMVTKNVPISERVRFNIQAAFLNAWNHPVFGNGTNPAVGGSVLTNGFTNTGSGPRNIELRANIIF